jgi:hypothetical protein
MMAGCGESAKERASRLLAEEACLDRERLRITLADREEKLQSARDTADRHIAESHALRTQLANMQREQDGLYLEVGKLTRAADEVNTLWYGKNPAVTPGGWRPALERLARARGLEVADDEQKPVG